MHSLDWITLSIYLFAMMAMSWGMRKSQKDPKDYYLAGNDLSPWPIALSSAATQCSTNSLLGAPAFVAFTGGLLWLQYELAVPLAMAVLILVFFPVYRRLKLFSVYDYIEQRFGKPTRLILSVLFQFLRAFSTGVTIYGISLVLEHLLGFSFFVSVILLGIFTIIYDMLGGMKAVIWSDVVQLLVLVGSILIACAIGVQLNGGFEATWNTFSGTIGTQTIAFSNLGLEGDPYGFWPMLIGGLFLYVSYYGCDQTQAQRELSTKNVSDSRKSLLIGGLIRFPIVLSYCFLGVCIGAYASLNPDFLSLLSDDNGNVSYNLSVPIFVLEQFPFVLKGLVIAGLFAAAMSSLDSTINSLSLLSFQDLSNNSTAFRKFAKNKTTFVNRALTALWGVVCIIFTFQVENIADTVIESINKIGSLVNGPLLGVFILGFFVKRAGMAAAVTGLATGFGTNLFLWHFVENLSWLWWNPIGTLVTLSTGFLITLVKPIQPKNKELYWGENEKTAWGKARTPVVTLLCFALLIFGVLWIIGTSNA
ncbi:MAG: sodium:solute symporter family transporter [Opitutales bacterium]